MKIVIINKSDERGGAAVVSRRLMHALQEQGVDCSMLVCEKLTDDMSVHSAASPGRIMRSFLAERLEIFARNGFNRFDLFKVDIADTGLPLSRHPIVQKADIVVLGWVNQGMLSLDEIRRIARLKPVVWVMHDLWCATGICHHPGECSRFLSECGRCPLLHCMKGKHDLSHSTWKRKHSLYSEAGITFVAVSNWLQRRCRESDLLKEERVEVIHNPIKLEPFRHSERVSGRVNILMTAARLDDPIKGLDTLGEAMRDLQTMAPDLSASMTLTLVGNIKDDESLRLLREIPSLKIEHHRAVPVNEIEGYYRQAHILVSPSKYETLPGTLVEAQLYGALPVAFDSGGQRDIITCTDADGALGVLADRSDSSAAAHNLAEALIKATEIVRSTPPKVLSRRLYDNVNRLFEASTIAKQFINLFNSLL